MPSKASLTASVSIHPRDGVSPDTVGKLRDWVGELKMVDWAVCVTEPNANGNGRHLHMAIGFKSLVKVSDDFKDRLRTCLKDELKDEANYGKVSIRCVAHDDPGGLVGGYYTKDDDVKEEFTMGNIPSADEQAQGAARREAAIEAKRKRTVSKSQIPYLFVTAHKELMADCAARWENDEYGNSKEVDLQSDTRLYWNWNAEAQVNKCYKHLIRQGYKSIAMELSPGKLKHFATIWEDLISSEDV